MTLTRFRRGLATAATWHVASQHHARRNALLAATALAQQRRERDEVEQFLAAHNARTDRSAVLHVSVPARRTARRTARRPA
jgi:hypothetical protein